VLGVIALAALIVVAVPGAGAQVGVIDQYIPPGHHVNHPPSHGGHGGEGTAASQGPVAGGPGGGASGGGGSSGGGNLGGGGAAGNTPTQSGASSPASAPGATERGGGSLPTGYPVTPLIWVLIAIVGAALLASVALAGRRRLRSSRRHAT
jgi:hypothetical protein